MTPPAMTPPAPTPPASPRVIVKLLLGVAVAGVVAVGAPAPAGAEPGPNPNPFTVLSCPDCPRTGANSGPAVRDQMKQGLRAALAGPQDAGPHTR